MRRIGIIGVGWLGEELLKHFLNKGFTLKGTVSSKEKQARLSHLAVDIIQFRLGEEVKKLNHFNELDYIIVTVPPSSHDNYVNIMVEIVSHLNKLNKDAIFIYTSSTSVYGSSVIEVDENSLTAPLTTNALKIIEVEKFFNSNISDRSIVIRLSGLVGGERHPVYFLSGKTGIKKPFAPINLVHREDIIRFIDFVTNKSVKNGVFNLCCAIHPLKKEYYQWVAKQKKLTIPQFDLEDKLKDKTVICGAIKGVGFTLQYQSPYDFPNE